MFIVIYRPHNTLNMDTKYYGPFNDFDTAYEFHCSLPALGWNNDTHADIPNDGIKHIAELTMEGK